jgi:ankyrin repeat protein
VNHADDKGDTALMLAAGEGKEDIVSELLTAGANVKMQNSQGWTALIHACEAGAGFETHPP